MEIMMRGFIRAGQRQIDWLFAWFDPQEESFSKREAQFKNFFSQSKDQERQ